MRYSNRKLWPYNPICGSLDECMMLPPAPIHIQNYNLNISNESAQLFVHNPERANNGPKMVKEEPNDEIEELGKPEDAKVDPAGIGKPEDGKSESAVADLIKLFEHKQLKSSPD